MNAILLRLFGTLLIFALLSGNWVFAQETSTRPGKSAPASRVTLDFKEIELADLINTISEMTGRNFLYDETVRGKATIVSPQGMSLDEAYQLFLTVLNLKGFTVVPSGKINKIVPLRTAKGANLPFYSGSDQFSDQYVTRLLRLENLDASTVAQTVLTPLLAETGNVVVFAPTNSLVITDSAANSERLAQLIRELDITGSAQTVEIIPLKYAGAEEVAKVCNDMLGIGSPAAPRPIRGAGSVSQADTAGKIIPFTRTNSLVVLATTEQLTAVHNLIEKIDRIQGEGRADINIYRLENASADELAKTLNTIISGTRSEGRPAGGLATVTADKPTNTLIINAKPEDYATLKGIIEKLDIKRKQVYVEALVMELSMDATQKLGVSLQGAATVDDDGLVFGSSNLNSGPIGFTDLSPSTSGIPGLLTKAVDGLLAGGFFNPITVTGPDGTEITVPSLSVLINLSKTDGDVNILSAPRLLTSDNEEAEIIVGSNVPIITSRLTDTGGSSGLAQSVSVERKDVALILRFTPQVTEGDLVRLNVYQEMTDIVPASAGLAASVGSPSQVGPTFSKRVLRNTVLAENGRTVVLGGLIGTNISETVSKVPLLGDIPLLGWLFKSKSTQERKTNLLVFINPTIIRGPEDMARVTGRNRQVAGKLMNEKTGSVLPENFFYLPVPVNEPPPAPAAADPPSPAVEGDAPTMPAPVPVVDWTEPTPTSPQQQDDTER